VVLAVLVLVLGVTPALAHHGTAAYDMDKTITLHATATSFDWSNPHCVVEMDVKGAKGETQHWVLELAAPIHMSRVGWTRTSIKPGDQIIAETNPAKNGAPVGISGVLHNVLKFVVNGAELPMR
jgi:uncharacterized protein DUF6152